MVERTYFNQPRAEMRPFVSAPCARVLEIGCAEGRFCAAIDGASERWGIEPDPHAAKTARGALDQVLEGTFDHCRSALPERYFDLIVCNDVIEHMTDHDAFLREIQHYLAPGGALVASVPNIRYSQVLWEILVQGDFRYRESGVLDRTHLRFFTLRSLRRSLEAAGFQLERLAPINRLPIRFRAERLVLMLLTVLTFGAMRDCWYRQLAFRARKL